MYSGRVESCSQRISKALSIRGMKQSELCIRTKIPKSSLSLYLSGAYEPKQDRLYDIAQALDVDPAWLMGFDVPMDKVSVTPDTITLTEGEKKWLELYNLVSDDAKKMLIKIASSFDKIPAENQRLLLDVIRVAAENQK